MTPEQEHDAPFDGRGRTYRGRSLDDVVPRIREELGDDAVIVGRRETTVGGVGGFFARREIEVDAVPGDEGGRDSASAAEFARHLAEASGAPPAAPRAAEAALSAADVTVDDLFPTAPSPAADLAALFDVGRAPVPADDEPTIFDYRPPAFPGTDAEPAASVEEPGADAFAIDEEPPAVPVDDPGPSIVEAFAFLDEDEPDLDPSLFDPPAFVMDEEPSGFAVPAAPDPASSLPTTAADAVARLVERGVPETVAAAAGEQAVHGLLPLNPDGDVAAAVRAALARHIPAYRLRGPGGVLGFVGAGGVGKTRCVARLAALHARHGALAPTVVALRPQDGGAELTRLLAPYGVALHVVESGAEGAARIGRLRGGGPVLVDTPGVSARSRGELKALAYELQALAPDELHLTLPATIAAAAARELLDGMAELDVAALAVTHTDETDQLGTVVGLSIATGIPISYVGRGQAVEAGLRAGAPDDLAAALLP